METSVKDIARLIELEKRKAELEFKKKVFGEENPEQEQELQGYLQELKKNAEETGVKVLVPNKDELDRLSERLGSFSPEELRSAVSTRSGEAYEVLAERGEIIKENFKNRLEIAKLSVVTSMLSDEEKGGIEKVVRSGSLKQPIKVSTLEKEAREKLARFMRRCGIECSAKEDEILPGNGGFLKEIRLEMPDRTVWVSEEAKEQLDEILSKIKDINSKIQLKNAERYVKNFTEEEEKAFEMLQSEYLELLKKKDELLQSFNEEEKLLVRS
ncbi:hypothetical protein GF318_01255 [Candidatus Micrarchaeota archaeon]|nr:hypothetical protein [Candidatus Micrarchaeota archaeon]